MNDDWLWFRAAAVNALVATGDAAMFRPAAFANSSFYSYSSELNKSCSDLTQKGSGLRS